MEEYPRNLAELEGKYSTEEACRAYLGRLRSAKVARWFSMPALPGWKVVAGSGRSAGVFGMWIPDVGNGRDNFSGYEDPRWLCGSARCGG
jgi:hypothetical protein